MDLSEYVNKKQEAAIGNSLRKNAGVMLCSKKKILLTSLFTGLVGGDRFLLGHYKRGILKALIF